MVYCSLKNFLGGQIHEILTQEIIPSLMAGWSADKIWARLEILKVCCKSKYSIFRFVLPQIINITNLIMASNEATRASVYIEIFQMEE